MSLGESSGTINTQILQASSMPEYQTNENFILWHERFEMHLIEIGCTLESIKVSMLLKSIGTEAYGVVHSLCSPALPSKKSYDDLISLLKQQYTPPKVIFQERKKFYAAKMAPTDTVTSWFAKVKKLAIDCGFGSNLDNFCLDKFVCELPPKIFDKLCEEDEKLSLSDALKKAMLRETKLNQMNGTATCSEINFVRHKGQSKVKSSKSNNNNNNYNSNKGTKSDNGNGKKPPC